MSAKNGDKSATKSIASAGSNAAKRFASWSSRHGVAPLSRPGRRRRRATERKPASRGVILVRTAGPCKLRT